MPFTLLTVPWSISDPGILDPADLGIPLASIPAGTIVEALLTCTAAFNNAANINGSLATSPVSSAVGSLFVSSEANATPTPDAVGSFVPLYDSLSNLAYGVPFIARTINACNFYLGIYSIGTPPATGAGELILKLYS